MELMRDTNPVHTDYELAARLGLRGPVAQGPASLAYVINMLLGWRGDASLERLEFRFQDTVTVGDTATAGAPSGRSMATRSRATCRLTSRPAPRRSGALRRCDYATRRRADAGARGSSPQPAGGPREAHPRPRVRPSRRRRRAHLRRARGRDRSLDPAARSRGRHGGRSRRGDAPEHEAAADLDGDRAARWDRGAGQHGLPGQVPGARAGQLGRAVRGGGAGVRRPVRGARRRARRVPDDRPHRAGRRRDHARPRGDRRPGASAR